MKTLRGSYAKRCGVTLAAMAVVFAGSTLATLPRFDARLAFALPQGAWPWATGSVFALGVTSFFLSALAVDVCRRVVPSLGRLARSGDAGRKRLAQPVMVVALLFAALAAVYVVRSVHAIVPLPLATKTLWLVTLIGGQCVLATLAWWISHRGIGQGFAIFCAFGIVSELQDLAAIFNVNSAAALSLGDIVQIVGVPLLIALITVLVLRLPVSRLEPRAWTPRVPVSGIGPVVMAFVLPMFVTLLALFGVVDARLAAAMTPGLPTFTVVASLFTVIMTVALGYANHSFVVDASNTRLRVAFWRSMPVTLLYVLTFVWRPAFVSRTVVDPLSVVIATAVCMDLGAEWVARATYGEMVVVARECDVAAADFTAWELRRANLAVLQRGVFFLTMTRFFGVLVPIELMVPSNREQEAIKLIAGKGGTSMGLDEAASRRVKTRRST